MVIYRKYYMGVWRMRLARNLLATISFVLAAVFLFMTILTFTAELEGRGLAIGLTVFFAVAGFLLKTKSKGRIKFEAERERLGIIESTSAHHLEGLPVSEKTNCQFTLHDDRLAIVGGGVNFNLSIQQITAIEVKTDVEIANVVHSSAAKGIAGGLLFGPIGLVVGSRATNKEKRTLHYYLIINYINSTGELAAMLFSDDIVPHLTKRLVTKLKPMITSNQAKTVQL